MIAPCVFQCLRVERVADSADSASGAPDETQQIRIIQIIRDWSPVLVREIRLLL